METDHPLDAESRPIEAPSTTYVIRTPDQRVRVFVSSTLDELAPERAAAREAITQLRLTPILFESGARPYPPRELYRAYLAQSDIFVGLYWQRYGWVAPTMQVSGPGGVGKTRLAIQVAADLASQFADGVAFISLASLKDPELVEPTVARALQVSEADGQAIGERLLEYLRPRQLLLLLDNAEQLVAAAAPLATRLLDAAQRLKLLVTSREPLRVRDERVVPVLPLALPDTEHLPDLETLAQVPAVALFVERAQEGKPDFTLTSENAVTIVEICQRLDGLPLALELAAARLSLLTPAALLARLEHRLPILTRGARDLPERQQTLRHTIAWSYDLLEADEQQLFRRLAVFVGGFTLEAVEAVCVFDAARTSSSSEADEGAVLEQLAQLLDKSLVQAQQGTGGEPRFTMLETIHEYAQDQLVASGEAAAVQQRHADYFLRLS